MGSILPRYRDGRTYEAVATVTGGQLVEARAGGIDNPGCGPAAAGSRKVVGVAQKDATPGGNAPRQPVAGVLDQTLAPAEVTVYGGGDGFVPVKYAAAAAFGDRVKAAADGTVTPWVSGTDGADLIVGWCAEKAGVAQDATGLTKITV